MLDTEYTVDAVEDEALDAALDEDTMFEDDTALDEEIMLDQEIMPGEDKIREDTALEDAMEEDAMLEETVLEDALLDAGVEDAMLEDTELDAAEVLDAMLDPTLDIGGALDMTLDTLGEGLIDALLEMMLDRTDDEELDGAELGTEHGWWEIMLLSRVTAPLRAYFIQYDNDVAWYGSAHSITKMALQPTFGRLYYSMRLKPTFCAAIALFGAGSIICALAPTSTSRIVGRAIQGLWLCRHQPRSLDHPGLHCIEREAAHLSLPSSPEHTRYHLSSDLFIGGVLTESHLTWRFCFWIKSAWVP
ncbi:hypothetical protein QBC37DRAFT_486443 [Rhypophila decipiens]|uniref:Uncharacterized protein n=1 Tax=Rhypophila decipiens TaxID=261697 RepID=A0AAN6Y3X7_9PEZI|nr:hypothetical protein QBC37DRAFT_486443 [Rhypophila decipiens]